MRTLFNSLILIIISFLVADCQAITDLSRGQVPSTTGHSFLKNSGQWADEVLYLSDDMELGAKVSFMKDRVSFGMCRSVSNSREINSHTPADYSDESICVGWSQRFDGANETAIIDGVNERRGKMNFLLGQDESKWVSHAVESDEVIYHNIYDGIDLRYYVVNRNDQLNSGGLKYDFIIHEGSDPNQIRMSFDGIETLSINDKGQLEVTHALGTYIEEAPYTYQVLDGKMHAVGMQFRINRKNQVSFHPTEEYDRSKKLIIDPGTLIWSTYMRATSNTLGMNVPQDLVVDGMGNVYISGRCDGSYPITTGSAQTVYGGGNLDVFVTKILPDGSDIEYSTYIGGPNSDEGYGITLDNLGFVYITARCDAGYPTTPGVISTAYNGGVYDIAITKLSLDGDAFVYSTYIGSTGSEEGYQIRVNALGQAYVCGITNASSYTGTGGVFQNNYGGGARDAFLLKIDATAQNLLFFTFIGGSDFDHAYGLDVDFSTGVSYVGGQTFSTDFPTQNPIQGSLNGINDAFLTAIADDGNGIGSTYLGGSGTESHPRIDFNSGLVYITSSTQSNIDFPVTPNALQPGFGGGSDDGFVSIFSADLSTLNYSTYLGGNDYDDGNSIMVGPSGDIYVAGVTISPDFPTTAYAFVDTLIAGWDLYITRISADGDSIVCSSYIGVSGAGWNVPEIFVTGGITDTIYLAGDNAWAPFPTTAGAYQQTKLNPEGSSQPYALKMISCEPTVFMATSAIDSQPLCFGDSTGIGIVTPVGGVEPYVYQWTLFGGSDSIATGLPAGSYDVTIWDDNGDSLVVSVIITEPSPVSAALVGDSMVSCFGDSTGSALLSGSGGTGLITYTWTPNVSVDSFANMITANNYNVLISDANGCDTTVSFSITEPTELTAVLTDSSGLLCNSDCIGMLEVSPSGGTPAYNYSWSSGQTNAIINNLCADIYSVTVTDSNGCGAVMNKTITEPPILELAVDSLTMIDCNGENFGKAYLSGFGGNPSYSYSWTPNVSNADSAVNLSAATYNITLSDQNNCDTTVSFTITEPPLLQASIIADTGVACYGDANGSANVSITGGTPNYSYSWTPSGLTDSSLSNLGGGVHSVLITDQNGCDTTIQFTIAEPDELILLILDTNMATCNGDSSGYASLDPEGGTLPYSFAWTPSGGPDSLDNNLAAGSYTVTLTDNNNCQTLVSFDITQPPATTLMVSGDSILCEGESTTLTASGNGDYYWSTGATTSSVTISPGTTVNIGITLTNACDTLSQTTFITVNPLPPTNAGEDTIIFLGSSVQLQGSGGPSWFWSPSLGLDCQACADPAANPLLTTTYYLWVTDGNNCSKVDSVTVTVESEVEIFVPNIFSPNGDNNNDFIQVYGKGVENYNIKIYNRWGEMMYESTDMAVYWNGFYNNQQLKIGTFHYVLEVNFYNGQYLTRQGYISLVK